MSYILDALRRSQAERESGQVPGLNAQPLPADRAGQVRRNAWAPWLGAGLGLGLCLAAAWWWLGPGAMPTPAVPAPTLAPAPAVAVTAAPATPLRLPAPALVSQAEPGLVPPTSPASQAAPATARGDMATRPTVVSAPVVSAPVVSAPAVQPRPQAASAPPVTATAQPPVPPRTVTLGELGADLRRELPPLAVGGAIWSENAARRFVLVNGQVVREGETAAPGVVLERIGPKSVLLRWREMRIEVPL
jgi:general secretion pathway protein B